jgi:hypothetical protein
MPYTTILRPALALLALAAAPLTSRASEWINLFNGRDLTGWSLAVEGAPVGQDPKGHVVVRDGAIHMYADTATDARGDFGVIVTDKKFSRYHLTFEYAWGPKKFAPRADKLKDAGLLYRIANPNERTWGIWPVSVECQIQEGDTADLVFLKTSALTWLHPQPGTAPEGQGHPGLLPEFGGLPERCTQKHHSYVGRYPVYDTPEGWNRVDAIVHADETAVHLVNGQIRSRLEKITDHTGAPLASGHIALQLEAAEVRYRDIRLRELPEPLRASASTLSFVLSPTSRSIPPQTLTITNPGPKSIPLTTELIGRDPARFTVTPAPGAPAELAPGASAEITVARAPAVNAASSGPAVAALQIGPIELGVLVLLQAP